MTQADITAALSALPTSHSPSGDWKDERYREEYRKQTELFDQACEDLSRRLHQEDPHDVFEVLFPLACVRYTSALPAHLLLYLKLPCPLSCKDAIRCVSRSEWDLSLEEMPWYLADRFGTAAIYQIIDELEQEDDIQEFKRTLALWHDANYGPISLHKYTEMQKEMPQNSVSARLGTIKYWMDILVRDEDGRLENWYPFWWRSKK